MGAKSSGRDLKRAGEKKLFDTCRVLLILRKLQKETFRLHVFLLRLPLAVHQIFFYFLSLLYLCLLCFLFIYSFQCFSLSLLLLLFWNGPAWRSSRDTFVSSVLHHELTGSAGQTARLTARQIRSGNHKKEKENLKYY